MPQAEIDIEKMTLPVMPEVAQKILEIRDDKIKVSSDQIGNIISADPALSGKILRLANSAYYARSRKVEKLADAITLLGIRTIKSLALLVTSSVLYTSKRSEKQLVQEIWLRSVVCGLIGRMLSNRYNLAVHPEDAFITGVLGQTGMLVLLDKDTERFAKLTRDIFQDKTEQDRADLEEKIYGFSSLTLTEKILQHWALPEHLLQFFTEHDSSQAYAIHQFADAFVYAGDLTGRIKVSEKYVQGRVESLYENGEKLSLKTEEIDKMLTELPGLIKSDEFYKLCVQLVG